MRATVYGSIAGFLLGFGAFAIAHGGPGALAQSEAWPWDASLDAVAAAPDSHRVVLENDAVRVLAVQIAPGEKEPPHTHEHPSVMIVHQPTRIRYYDADGRAVLESPAGPRPDSAREPQWMEPEGLHAVENLDAFFFQAYRIEIKKR